MLGSENLFLNIRNSTKRRNSTNNLEINKSTVKRIENPIFLVINQLSIRFIIKNCYLRILSKKITHLSGIHSQPIICLTKVVKDDSAAVVRASR
jgi:hypothetical protein